MAGMPIRAILNHLRRTVAPADDALSDGPLLEAYVQRLDEDAFAELLRRHGPMVLGVCRRILRDAHRAEDAFQATFLILVRKAGSLRCEVTLAGWLYRVALNTARHARAADLRRRETAEVADMPNRPSDTSAEAPDWVGLQPILDEELRRLPERLRLVLVLCGLEGRSREEAGRLLCISACAVKGRLERGRERLRRRLERRGFALPAAAFASLLTAAAAPAVPAALASATLKIARAVSAGQAIASQSAPIARLVEGVLHTMLKNRIQFVAVALASLALLVGGAVAVSQWFGGAVVSAPVAAPADLFEGDYRVLNTPARGRVVFSADGRQVVFVADGKIQVWDIAALVRGAAPARTIDLPDAGPMSISPDGKLLALAHNNGLKLVSLGDQSAVRPGAATDKALENTVFGGWSADGRELFVVRRKLGAERINLQDGKSTDVATRPDLEKACGGKIDLLGIRGVHGSGDQARVFMVGTRHVSGAERRKELGLPEALIGLGTPPEDHQWSFLKAANTLAVTNDNADLHCHANKELSRFFCTGFKSQYVPPSFMPRTSKLIQLGTADATLKPQMGEKIDDLSPPDLQGRSFHHLTISDDVSRALVFLSATRLIRLPIDSPEHRKKLEQRFAEHKFVVQPVQGVRPVQWEMLVYVPVWALYVLDAVRNEVKPLTKFYGESIDELKDPALVRVDGVYDSFGWSKAAGVVAVSLKSKLFLLKVPAWER